MILAGRIVRTGLAAFALTALSALTLVAAPRTAQAFTPSEPPGSTVHGASSDFEVGALTTCHTSFTGQVTSDAGRSFGGMIRIDRVGYAGCTGGVTVTAHAVPQSFSVDPAGGAGMSVDVDVATARGTCHYSGGLSGTGNGHYNFAASQNSLFRQSSGCGGPSSIATGVDMTVTDANGDLVGI